MLNAREKCKQAGWYLGVILDSKLTMIPHYEHVSKKIKTKISVLRKVKWTLSRTIKQKIYDTMVRPHYSYCPTLLYSAHVTIFQRLQILSNECMRIILSQPRDARGRREAEIDEMRKKLGWCTVNQAIFVESMTFLFKIANRLLPQYLQAFLPVNSDVHLHDTRGSTSFARTRVRGNQSKSIFYNGAAQYNRLSTTVRESKTVLSFQKRLRIECEAKQLTCQDGALELYRRE